MNKHHTKLPVKFSECPRNVRKLTYSLACYITAEDYSLSRTTFLKILCDRIKDDLAAFSCPHKDKPG